MRTSYKSLKRGGKTDQKHERSSVSRGLFCSCSVALCRLQQRYLFSQSIDPSYIIFAILQGIRGDAGSVGMDGDKGRTVSLNFSLLLSAVVSILS